MANIDSIKDDQYEESDDKDIKRVNNAVHILMEHFDTCHIFVTRHIDSDEGTMAYNIGDDSWYARRGQIGDWIKKQDHRSKRE